MAEVRLSEVFAPTFIPVHQAIKNNTHTQFWLKGGRGSTKTSFVALEIVLGIVKDPDANALCLRKVGDTLRTSVHASLLWAIDKLQLTMFFRPTVSPAEFTYIPTGQQILLKGLDEPVKLKSIRAKRGYFKFLWFEEAAEFSNMKEIRNVEQSVLRGGSKFVEFLTYNPPNDPAAWVNLEVEIPAADKYVHTSSYLDVPREWLGEKFIKDAETLRERDSELYLHEYMGQTVGRSDQIVFSGRWIIEDFEPSKEWDGAYFGADWGFSQDPTTLVKCWIFDRRLYVEHELYKVGLEIDHTPMAFEHMDGAKSQTIRADSARPETISYVRRAGFNIVGVEKWKGSVEDGIAFLKSFDKIVVHSRCVNTIKEMRLYSYKVNKAGDVLTDLANGNDHIIDALRYAVAPLIKQAGVGGVIAL